MFTKSSATFNDPRDHARPEARILVDGARPADTASETNASLCRYASCRFIVASGLAESRGGLVAASLAVVLAGKSRRCGADSAEAFARGVGLSSASEEWEARRTNHIMLQGKMFITDALRTGVGG